MAVLEIGVSIDGKSLDTDFKKIEGKATSGGRNAGDAYTKGFSVGAGALSVALGTIAVKAFQTITRNVTQLVSNSIDAASRQQAAVNSLNVALQRTGNFSEQSTQSLQAFAAEIERTTRFSDEAAIEQLAFAQSLGATAEQSKAIVSASTDLAAALNISFESAVRNVTKTLGGLKGELGETIPELGRLTKEQLQAGDAIDIVARKFRGAATGELNTFAGQNELLANTFGTLQEKIGQLIVESPALIGFFRTINQTLNSLVVNFPKLSSSVTRLAISLIEIGRVLNNFIVAPLELTFNAVRFVFSKINEFVAASVATVGVGAGKLAGLLQSLGINNNLTESLSNFAETSNQVFQDVSKDSQEAFGKIFEGTAFGNTEEFLNRLQTNIELANAVIGENPVNIEPTISAEKVNDSLNSIAATAKQTGAIVNAGFTNVVSQSIQKVVANITKGENAFSGFGKLLFGLFADIAIQIGQVLIAAGIGIKSLFGLNGAAAIAAGAGLVAIGSVLKSFIGGGDSGPSGGLDNSANTFANNPDTALTADDQRESPQTAVTVNIQGDVLDSEESSLRIAELLQKAVSDQGVRFV